MQVHGFVARRKGSNARRDFVTSRRKAPKEGHEPIAKEFKDVDLGINIVDSKQTTVIHCSNRFVDANFTHTDDNARYVFEIDNILKPGIYTLVLFLRTEDVIQDVLNNEVSFEISDGNPYGFNDSKQFQGSILPQFSVYKK